MGTTYLVARTKTDPLSVATALRQSVREAAPMAAVPEVLTLEEAMWESTAERRLRTAPVLALSGMSVLITFVGLFGMSQRIALERRRELAIRAAVGASPGRIALLLSRTALAILAMGLTLGWGLAWGVGRMLAGLLYGVTPTDLAVLLLALSAVAAGGLFACYLPGRRASRVEPIVDLR
jgi:ABC-type antimicrobial peptide transport system permease subunit